MKNKILDVRSDLNIEICIKINLITEMGMDTSA